MKRSSKTQHKKVGESDLSKVDLSKIIGRIGVEPTLNVPFPEFLTEEDVRRFKVKNAHLSAHLK